MRISIVGVCARSPLPVTWRSATQTVPSGIMLALSCNRVCVEGSSAVVNIVDPRVCVARRARKAWASKADWDCASGGKCSCTGAGVGTPLAVTSCS